MSNHLDERGDPPSATHESDRKTFTTTETRQGRLGFPVFVVLATSLVLAMLVWGAIALWADDTDADAPTAAVEEVQPSPSNEQTGSVGSPPRTEEGIPAPTDRDPTYQTGTGGPSPAVTPDGTVK
ncbi:hypothetical protein [Sinorhizobium alkalisoli]|uniref:Uncharacterized protein n=1 Tax=Sinorhizobium alkalisoli TaxID=1752398 RepID=A0A1E3VH56_9HYPH|nr:hypothetical protein [Sinorhizobium alkalisoli]MCA1491317.1 hypothetical protein [Ensifer sp. NBAIM29]MCG5478930.1 hypothetical protein [Sinorhizobium alkalisoli]ODR92864.1 hypothetical protein A8M32_02870 [Sinorhizobium alkalisoli]